jgi:hypothetical protein
MYTAQVSSACHAGMLAWSQDSHTLFVLRLVTTHIFIAELEDRQERAKGLLLEATPASG